jgi:hypothetical protein
VNRHISLHLDGLSTDSTDGNTRATFAPEAHNPKAHDGDLNGPNVPSDPNHMLRWCGTHGSAVSYSMEMASES